jgi:glycolate oxidase
MREQNAVKLQNDLLSILSDPSSVITDLEKRVALGKDEWFAAALPEIAVAPTTSQEVAAVLAYANENNIPVTTRGAGYGYVGGCVPVRGGILLTTERLHKILEIHPGDFVAVIQPAVITSALQEAVEAQGLFYPPDPASRDHCSLGGNIATNAGGPRCLKYGVTRNYILGLEVALADGTLVRLGGRTHKNKTGLDLIGMFVGSEGLLGVITEATLRLLPLPPARATLSAGFATMQGAAAAIQAIFAAGYLPCAVEVADHFTLEAARSDLPKELQTLIPPGQAHLLLEIDGQEASVASESTALQQLLIKHQALQVQTATTSEACQDLWQLRRSFSMALRATGLTKLNEDIVVPRSRLVDLINFTEQLQKESRLHSTLASANEVQDVSGAQNRSVHEVLEGSSTGATKQFAAEVEVRKKSSGFPIACFGHAGDGNIHVNIMVSKEQQRLEADKIDHLLQKLFTQVLEWHGSITGEHGIGLAKLPWWNEATSPELRDLHSRIKSALDPKQILNPGKFV